MAQCTRCKAFLTQSDYLAGCCAACGLACKRSHSTLIPPVVPSDSPKDDAPISQTSDHFDPVVLPESDQGSRTIAEGRIDGTVDLGTLSGPSQNPSQGPSQGPSQPAGPMKTIVDMNVGGGTVEFDVGPLAPSTGGATIGPGLDDAESSAEEGADAGGKPGTVHVRAAFGTMEFEVGPAKPGAGKPAPGGATNFDNRNIAGTYDSDTFGSGTFGSGIERQLADAWGTAVNHRGTGGVSLKGKDPASSRTDQTLVVNTRAIIPVSKKDPQAPRPADYELLHLLGEGGMGVVYSARQTSIDRTVAVKMLKAHAAKSRDMQQKFLSEAVVTGDLDHPNIVPMYDLGKNEDGDLFYAMKRVQGTPWSKVIAKKTQPENIEILLKIADAVAFAHARGVIHRDLKPENVMLGEFGETLLMDWGLAYSTAEFRKSASITQTHSMGGSPAYMAPEMATGPIERINMASDVYLLGAILYEILTGKAPHAGSNVSKCLIAAARNDIIPTDKTGELVDVARRAMATEQRNRYASVRDLQAAIRECLAHSESIALAARADQELQKASETSDYRTFSRAVFGYEEALALWSGNEHAAARRFDARLAYATCAYDKGDYDLAAGLLERSIGAHGELAEKIEAANQEREARRIRLRRAKKAMYASLAALFVIGATAFYGIRAQRDVARNAEAAAEKSRDEARQSADEAERLRVVAENSRDEAEQLRVAAVKSRDETEQLRIAAVKSRDEAESSRLVAEKSRDEARKSRDEAEKSRVAAVKSRDEAETSRIAAEKSRVAAETSRIAAEKAKAAEQYEAYVARIGLAAARIEENAFNSAVEILKDSPVEMRNWEWGRLEYLCGRSSLSIDAGPPVESVAVDSTWQRFASGGWNGKLRLWNAADGALVAQLPYAGSFVKAVAFSGDGRYLAVGGSDPAAYAQVWDLATLKPVTTLVGHTGPVVSIAFDQKAERVLTTSNDGKARLWSRADGKLLRSFHGHSSAVLSAALSPDEKLLVTTGQDGAAIVWDAAAPLPAGETEVKPDEIRAFLGHKGPIRSVAFAPDGRSVATCGDDNRVLFWSPGDVRPYRLSEVFGENPPAKPKARELLGHRAAVASLAFSADGRRLISGGLDNAIFVWNVASGIVEKELRGHAGQVRACRISADGRLVVSGSYDGTLKVWDVDAYQENIAVKPSQLAGHVGAVLAANFSPDETQIVTAGLDRTAMLWDLRSLNRTATLAEGHEYLASNAVVSTDGARLITAAVDGTVRVWDTALGTQLAALPDTGRNAAVAVSRDGRFVLTGKGRLGAALWELPSGKLVHTLPDHRGEVTAVAFSPDGKLLFTGEASGRTNVWSAGTKDRLWSELHHSARISAAAFTHDGAKLLTASLDNSVGVWDAKQGREFTELVWKHPAGVTSLSLLGADRAATACEDGRVRIWSTTELKPAVLLPLAQGNYASVAAPAGGERLAAVDQENGLVRIWDFKSARELAGGGAPASQPQEQAPWLSGRARNIAVWNAVFSPDGASLTTIGGNEACRWSVADATLAQEYRPHGAIAGVAFSPDGKFVATAGLDDVVKIWDVAAGRAVRKLHGRHTGGINSVVYSPDGESLLTASDDRTAALWRAGDGTFVREFTGHADRVTHAAFSPDGLQIATSSGDKTARIWKIDGTLLHELKGHEWAVLWVEFSGASDGGARVVTAGADDVAKIWDAKTGALQHTLAGHTAAVNAAVFSPDGKRLVTGSRDAGVKLWDAKDGKELLTLRGHRQEVTSVRFSPSGRSILTSSRDGRAIVWPTIEWRAPPTPAEKSLPN